MMNNVTVIPFFDSLGPDALKFVINQTGLSTMFIEGTTIQTFIDLAQNKSVPTLTTIVCFDEFSEEQKFKVEAVGLKIYSY
mmetsp:Transcript_43354/g.41778  ORF Transcript_43354/g.41778 Transcript_43354/m.41778 type:complete len:81 (+) Transcript_43354:447-689(+)